MTFRIEFSPVRSDATLTVSVEGDTLTVNEDVIDCSSLGDGDTMLSDDVACDMVIGDVTRVGDELRVVLILPHGGNASEGMRFPAPLTVTDDGPVSLPLDSQPDPL